MISVELRPLLSRFGGDVISAAKLKVPFLVANGMFLGRKSKEEVMDMKKISTLPLIALLIIAGTAFAGRYSKTETRNYNITADGKVTVENVNGDIYVESWDKNQVSLQIKKTVRADDQDEADEYFTNLSIEIESGKDFLEVHTHYPHEWNRGFFDWLFHLGEKSADVEYTLKVPVGVTLDLGSTNGKVEVQDVSGDVKAHSTNGGINLDGVTGEIDASTTNGGISISVSKSGSFKDLEAKTTNGGIKIYCPQDIDADIEAHTTNGGIDTEFPVTVSGSFNSKSLDGKINNGGKRMYLHTTNGGIQILKK